MKTVYKIIINKSSNDFNNEPEYKVQAYTVLDENNEYYLTSPKGLEKKSRKLIRKSEFYNTKKEAFKVIKEMI